MLSGNGLTLYQMTNSGLVQIESPCRWQNNVTKNLTFVLGKVANILGKGEKYWLPALFPKMFLKAGPFSGSLKVGVVRERVKWGKFSMQ